PHRPREADDDALAEPAGAQLAQGRAVIGSGGGFGDRRPGRAARLDTPAGESHLVGHPEHRAGDVTHDATRVPPWIAEGNPALPGPDQRAGIEGTRADGLEIDIATQRGVCREQDLEAAIDEKAVRVASGANAATDLRLRLEDPDGVAEIVQSAGGSQAGEATADDHHGIHRHEAYLHRSLTCSRGCTTRTHVLL